MKSYSIIIPLTKTADEIKRYKTEKAFKIALARYMEKFTIGFPIGEKSYKFIG